MKTSTMMLARYPDGGMIAPAWRALVEGYMRRRARRIAARNLGAVSDRTLKDIGIHRSEILSLVNDTSTDRRRRNDRA